LAEAIVVVHAKESMEFKETINSWTRADLS